MVLADLARRWPVFAPRCSAPAVPAEALPRTPRPAPPSVARCFPEETPAPPPQPAAAMPSSALVSPQTSSGMPSRGMLAELPLPPVPAKAMPDRPPPAVAETTTTSAILAVQRAHGRMGTPSRLMGGSCTRVAVTRPLASRLTRTPGTGPDRVKRPPYPLRVDDGVAEGTALAAGVGEAGQGER